MILTKEQVKELETLTDEIVKYLNDNFHPHVKVIVDPTGAEIVFGSAYVKNEKHIRD